MSQSAEQPVKSSGKSVLIVRIILVAVLIVVAVVAVVWRGLLVEYRRSLDLYEEGKYTEAHAKLEAVVNSPFSVIKIRSQARRALGLCKAELASDIAFKERSIEGYKRALRLLDEAKELAGASEEIERRIEEYSEYKAALERTDQERSGQ